MRRHLLQRSRARWLTASVVGLSMIAAACGGGGDGGDEATSGTVDENVKSAVNDALNSSTTAAGSATTVAKKDPTSKEEWDKLNAEERKAVVDKIKASGAGKSGTTVKGTEGFTIDLSKCEAGWSDTEGLSDTEIKIGHTTALSGTLADYGNIAKVFDIYFADLAKLGGIKDSTGKTRNVKMITKDDGYDANRTIPLVDELIDSEKVFAVITLGSANTMKTYDKLNKRCIPQPISMTGHPAWGDPVGHPWTTGQQLAYNTEAVLWGSFIDKNFAELSKADGKVTVGALVMNNDFGKSYIAAFNDYVATSPNKANIEIVSETIEPQAPTVTDPMTTIASKNPEIFISMTAGTPCTQSIQEAANNGLKESAAYLFQPSVCAASTFVGKDKVGGDGSASDGWWIVNGGSKDLNDAGMDNDPYIKWSRELLKANGLDPKASGSFGSGYYFAWTLHQALDIASQLDGGLSRSNLMVAMRALDMTHPFLLPGIKFNMNGVKDSYYIEGGVYQKYDFTKQSWANQGNVIDLSGKSKNCAWDQSAGVCK